LLIKEIIEGNIETIEIAAIADDSDLKDVFNEERFKLLAEALSHPNCKVQVLDFEVFDKYCYCLNNDTIDFLVKILESKNKCLKKLILYGNQLTTEVLVKLARALTHENASVTELNLSNTELFLDELNALFPAFTHPNTTIEVLDLSLNLDLFRNSACVEILVAILQHPNNKLRVLKIGKNDCNSDIIAELRPGLQHHNCLLNRLDIHDSEENDCEYYHDGIGIFKDDITTIFSIIHHENSRLLNLNFQIPDNILKNGNVSVHTDTNEEERQLIYNSMIFFLEYKKKTLNAVSKNAQSILEGELNVPKVVADIVNTYLIDTQARDAFKERDENEMETIVKNAYGAVGKIEMNLSLDNLAEKHAQEMLLTHQIITWNAIEQELIINAMHLEKRIQSEVLNNDRMAIEKSADSTKRKFEDITSSGEQVQTIAQGFTQGTPFASPSNFYSTSSFEYSTVSSFNNHSQGNVLDSKAEVGAEKLTPNELREFYAKRYKK